MEENFKNKFGLTIFILVILFLLIGGYIYTKYALNDEKKNDVKEKEISYKIDENEPYIYFKNEEVISESAEIYFKDVVINLTTQENLTKSLEGENRGYKNNIKYKDSKTNVVKEDLCNYDNDNLYMLTYREYQDYEYNNYVSLLINKFNYSCIDNSTFIGTKSYIFDTKSGRLLTEDEILTLYNLTMNEIKRNIRSTLESKQTKTEEGVELLNIDETINDLEHAFYINDYGRLYITYLVKTNDAGYNEIMEVK